MRIKKNARLSVNERAYIVGCRIRGESISRIAEALGRDKSVVSRELKRNRAFYEQDELTSTERAALAHEATRERRREASKRERLKSPAIRDYVERCLKQSWSPELISGRMGIELPGNSISAEAIYQWIYYERTDLQYYLLRGNKERWKRSGAKRRRRRQAPPCAPKTSIDERPLAANNREEIGHFETDAIVSKKSTESLMTTVDRKTRRIFISKTPNLKSETYSLILIKRIQQETCKKHRKTFTFDNGPENAAHQQISTALNVKSFFCHPYCASERGTVENRNGFIRRFFPKGTNFAEIPDEYVQYVEELANNRPMKCLQFLTPNEVWQMNVAADR